MYKYLLQHSEKIKIRFFSFKKVITKYHSDLFAHKIIGLFLLKDEKTQVFKTYGWLIVVSGCIIFSFITVIIQSLEL